MNNPHKNARMTPLGRAEMIRRIVEDGRPVAVVAAGFGISERTARKWLSRWRSDGTAGLENRSSRPLTANSGSGRFWADLAVRLRREYRLTGDEIASRLGLARSTVASWLTRLGLDGCPRSSRRSLFAAINVSVLASFFTSTSKSSLASKAWVIASPAIRAAAVKAWGTTSCTLPSMTRRGWPT